MKSLKAVAFVSISLLAFAYPFFIYWSIQRFEPKFIGLAIGLMYFCRIFWSAQSSIDKWLSLSAILAFSSALWFFNHPYFLKLFPTLITLAVLILFTRSLVKPPTIPARFAEKIEGPLSTEQVRYTDRITYLWILFFLFNICVSAYTAFFSSIETWTLYNGLISYLIMGAMFIGEYLYRRFIFIPQLQHD